MIRRCELVGRPLLAYWTAVFLAMSCCGLTGCGPGPVGRVDSSKSNVDGRTQPYRVVTTVAMVTDIVRVVAGERAEVTGLLGEGVDPHLYKPTRNDVQKLLQADIVFYSGLNLEGRMQETFQKLSGSGKVSKPVTSTITQSYLRTPPEFAGHPDPHVWMDVGAWSNCVKCVAETLGEFDPGNAAEYLERAESYRKELAKLDEYIREGMKTIAREQRVLITAHDAFGYFGRAYDIEVRAPQGISTESEASVEDINGLVDFIVQRKIGALFVESSVNPKSIRAVIEGAKARGQTVAIGGQLYSDAMGERGTYRGTYIGMMDHNATTIIRSLGGRVPLAGYQGKLTSESK